MKYHRHPRLYMTDKDKQLGFQKKGDEKTTYTPQT